MIIKNKPVESQDIYNLGIQALFLNGIGIKCLIRKELGTFGDGMQEFTFTVDSALLSELGERLVASVHVALSELVKNAYDADAKKVTVSIKPMAKGGPKIEIQDDGTGMTLEEVRKYWMKIGTSHKQKHPVSELFGRPLTGQKGIGRFCCRRLGRTLVLKTTARSESGKFEHTAVTFDWATFIPGKDVSTVTCPGSHSVSDKGNTGTTLIITDSPEDEWQQRGFNYLKRQLAVLTANRGVRRKGYKEDPGFEIALDAPGFDGGLGDLREQLMNAGWATLTARIESDGRVVCQLTAKGIGQKQITSHSHFHYLQGTTLRLGVMPDEKEQLRDTKVLSQGNLREILKDWGGIQVRHNGFRVYPYGDDDWLYIDRDRGLRKGLPNDELFRFAETLQGVDPRRALLNMLSMKSYVGSVDIGSSTSGFEIKINREGFVENSAYRELVEFTRFCVDWSTIYRDFYLRRKAEKEADEARKEFEKTIGEPVPADQVVHQAVEVIQKEADTLSSALPANERREKKQSILKAVNAIAKYDKTRTDQIHHLRLVSSTSTLVLIFSHEIKALLGILESATASLDAMRPALKGKNFDEVTELSASLQTAKERFADLISLTSLMSTDSRKAKETRLHLKDRASRSVNCFKIVVNHNDISIDSEGIPNNLLVGPMLEAELYAILINVLSNSIKAVIAGGGKKEIRIQAERRDDQVVISVMDTGVGLPESEYENVFSPFVADPDGRLYSGLDRKLNPEDRFIVGTGSGLGLTIVRDVARRRGGDVYFCKPIGKWKTHLEITLP